MVEWHEDFDPVNQEQEEYEEKEREILEDLTLEPLSNKELKKEALEGPTFDELRAQFFKRMRKSWTEVDKLFLGADAMTIMGKTIAYWHDYFRIEIPASPSMAELFECMSKANSLITTVNHKLSISQLSRDVVARDAKQLKATKFVTLKRGNGKARAPSNDMVAMQVEEDCAENLDQLMIAEYVTGFWENKRQALISTRKTLEAMMFGLTSEMKMKNSVPDNQYRD